MKPLEMNGKQLQFPVDWEFRIIVESGRGGPAREAIEAILEKHNFPPGVHEGLHSESGRYRSFKVPIIIPNRETLEKLAVEFHAIEGVKFIL